MAAEMNFGDPELFEVFGTTEESTLKTVHTCIKGEGNNNDDDDDNYDYSVDEEEEDGVSDIDPWEQLRQCKETIEQLRAENQKLKRKLNIQPEPSGMLVNNSNLDGPLLQILYMNNAVSKQYHQEVEEFVLDLVKRYKEQQKSDVDMTSFDLASQLSNIVLEDQEEELCATESNNEAFSAMGSVLYFTDFCLDKLGQPLLRENPQLTQGWEIPKYHQVFSHVVSPEGQKIQIKANRPKPHCFNCGSGKHLMKGCPMPRNAARISENRKEFMDARGPASNRGFQQRYYMKETEERFGRFKPGVISKTLQDALGVTGKCLPPYIYRMRQLGYPPGWLKEVEWENSGLILYDRNGNADGETETGEVQQSKSVTYDISKLVSYPGFNVPMPTGVPDEWRVFGPIPVEECQQKDVFASYLTSGSQGPSMKSGSRKSSSQSSPSCPEKQRKKAISVASPTDKELDSDVKVPHGSQSSKDFQFRPPSTPPPLPWRMPVSLHTPPFPKDAVLLIPSDSPQAQPIDAATAMDTDTLMLQGQSWAALEQAKSISKGSDIPMDTPLTGNSDASSPCPNERNLLVPGEKASEKPMTAEPEVPDTRPKTAEVEHPLSPASEATLLCQKEEEESAEMECKGSPLDGSAVSDHDTRKGDSQKPQPSTSTQIHSSVPDLSKFAAGISPFVFDNVAESTGVYLRIKNLLKNSPQRQKKKKASE